MVANSNHFANHICDWIYGNRSKLHTGSYRIIDFKDYNRPKIVSTRIKLTEKVDQFTVFESLPSTSYCSQKFPPNDLAGWTCEVVSGMFSLGEWQGIDWREKVTVQNCGRALVKPKNQPGGVVLAP